MDISTVVETPVRPRVGVLERLREWAYPASLGVFALLFSLARFTGLESHSGYYGMTYKLVHPESFPNDAYANFDQPAMASLYSLLVKLAGPLWLDDRFNAVVYFLVVVVTLWGVDRILGLLGVTRPLHKLAVIAVFAVGHQFIDNIPQLVDSVCYRPSTYAYPFGTWLAYLVLKGAPPKKTLPLALAMVLTSLKNAWFPFIAAVLLLARRYVPKADWRGIAAAVAVLVLVFFTGWYAVNTSNGTVKTNAALFDHAHAGTENSEADPFMDGAGPFIFLAVLAVAYALPLKMIADRELVARVKALVVMTGVTYVLGGMYYTYIPDALKVPLTTALAVNRSTWWTQNILWLVLTSNAVLGLVAATSRREKAGYAAAGLLLYVFPLFEHAGIRSLSMETGPLVTTSAMVRDATLVAVFAGVLALGAVSSRSRRPLFAGGASAALVVAVLSATALSFTYKAYSRIPDLWFCIRTGIMGGTEGAKWHGVNEYIVRNTRRDATIYALSYPLAGGRRLRADTSIKIRTGRTMPFGHEINFYFDYAERLRHDERRLLAARLAADWTARRPPLVIEDLREAGTPDYVIVPANALIDLEQWGYRKTAEVEDYAILRHNET